METDYQGRERKAFKRIKQQFTTRIRVSNLDEMLGWNLVVSRNLSAGGILFNFDREIPMDTPVELKIQFPLLRDPIFCKGKVVRVQRSELPSIYSIAALFTHIDTPFVETINAAAEDFYSKKPGRIEP